VLIKEKKECSVLGFSSWCGMLVSEFQGTLVKIRKKNDMLMG